MGSSQNNLSIAELNLGNKNEAELYCMQAIQNAEELLQVAEEEESIGNDSTTVDHHRGVVNKARRVLSDRRGNLAMIYLQQDRFVDAFETIEQLLADDKKIMYIRGLVVKQGTLGQYYLKQGETASAERIFRSTLDFILRKDQTMYSSEWNEEVYVRLYGFLFV